MNCVAAVFPAVVLGSVVWGRQGALVAVYLAAGVCVVPQWSELVVVVSLSVVVILGHHGWAGPEVVEYVVVVAVVLPAALVGPGANVIKLFTGISYNFS